MGTYWDTSCVLKLYCREEDSSHYLERLVGAKEPILTSILTASELVFAFHQKELRKEVAPGAAIVLHEKFSSDVRKGRFSLLPLGADVREEARRIAAICYSSAPAVPLRTLDGFHLATAKAAKCLKILTTDSRMLSAATILGFATED